MVARQYEPDERSPFTMGTLLDGQQGAYRLSRRIGHGMSGETWEASDNNGKLVIVKLPLLDPDELLDTILQRTANLTAKFQRERVALTRLAGLPCAAEFIDHGLHNVTFAGEPVAILFMVQRLICGVRLDERLAALFPSGADDRFNGIPRAREFFTWAKEIARALLEIHQRQVVHGDIWLENIMVENDNDYNDSVVPPRIVFIDFGEALLRNHVPPSQNGTHGASKRLVAPEGSGSVCADVYSFGGVLYTLATGDSLPSLDDQTIDGIKNTIAIGVRTANPSLYRENHGIVDVIARMLRHDQAERSTNVDVVLRDLETFSPDATRAMRLPEEFAHLTEQVQQIEQNDNDVFRSIASRAVHTLAKDIGEMLHGVYDLCGTHEDVVSGLTEYLSTLRSGHQYLTVTVPSFWSKENIGTNGRYLAMNTLAAQRGATIRRIFLFTEDEDPKLVNDVIAAHLHAIEQLTKNHPRIETRGKDPSMGGFFTGFVTTTRELAQALAGRQNYGLSLHGDKGLLMVPVYRNDNVLTTLQFRSNRAIIEEFRRDFEGKLRKCRPLEEYKA